MRNHRFCHALPLPVWLRLKGVMIAILVAGVSSVAIAPVAEAKPAPRRVLVSDRQVVIAGPEGYCIDMPAARDGSISAFVLLGSCAAIGQSSAEKHPIVPAVLTASVARGAATPVANQLPALNNFFRSEAGRAALSRSGRAGTVTVLQAKGKGGVFYLYVRDTSRSSGSAVPQGQPEYWRAVLDVHGRIVTLNVVGLREHPISSAAGLATLEAFVRQVQAENRGPAG